MRNENENGNRNSTVNNAMRVFRKNDAIDVLMTSAMKPAVYIMERCSAFGVVPDSQTREPFIESHEAVSNFD